MVSCVLAGQFTLEWSEVSGCFPAGRSNLYTLSDAHGKPEVEPIIRGLAAQHPEVVAMAEDAVGAKLVHGLLVANSERSIKLALELFEIHPPLLLGTHGQNSADKPVIKGEGSMHIVAVNQRRYAVEFMVRTAVRRMSPAQVQELLSQTCTGLFFKGAPMRYFGGSVMAYLSVVGLLIPVLPLLESLPEERMAALHCRGKRHAYTALHATVLAGRVPEFNALVKYGSDEFAEDRDGFNPMQLAVQMGMQDIFIHSLRHRVKTEWVWGPIAAYKLPLIGLDTEGTAGEQTVMDLTADAMALDKTKTMLLDSFMNGACLTSNTPGRYSGPPFHAPYVGAGFIFNLFVEKWHRYASESSSNPPPPHHPPTLLHSCRPFARLPSIFIATQVGPLPLGFPARRRFAAGLQHLPASVAIVVRSKLAVPKHYHGQRQKLRGRN